MSETNACKEHLLCNENERNTNNIDIVFDSHQIFKHSINPRHLRQNFIDPRHPRYSRYPRQMFDTR